MCSIRNFKARILYFCQMSSLTEENYLKTLYHKEQEANVSVKEIAKQLDIKMPTVNSMIKKLAEKKLVKYEKYKSIELTDLGRKKALSILRKHRLTELFLTQIMNLGWGQVHDIAEQIEHIQSELFFNRIDEILGNPKFDPHGEPIPDKEGKLPSLKTITLSNGIPQQSYTLSGVNNNNATLLSYLDKIGLAIHDTIEIKEIEPFDLSMTVLLNRKTETIFSAEICKCLLVI